MEYIDAGLKSLIDVVRARSIQSVAVPALGCGLGGLDWHDVHRRIMNAFADLPSVRVLLFEPAADLQTNRPGTARKQAMYKKHR